MIRYDVTILPILISIVFTGGNSNQNPVWTQKPSIPLCLHTILGSHYYNGGFPRSTSITYHNAVLPRASHLLVDLLEDAHEVQLVPVAVAADEP